MAKRRKRSRYVPKRVIHVVNRRARKGPPPCQLRETVCDDQNIEYHHRFAFAEGGKHTANNLVALCDECHKFVHSPTNADAMAEIGLILEAQPKVQWQKPA